MGAVIQPPFFIFTDIDGSPLENGSVTIGWAGLNAEANPQQAYWDDALTIPASNIRTRNGYIYRNGTPARLYTGFAYSIMVRNSKSELVYSSMNPGLDAITIQGLQPDDILIWDATKTYDTNDPVFFNGVPFRSKINGNLGNDPDLNPDKWEVTGGGSGSQEAVGYNLENGQFDEKQLFGWETYADAAGVEPVDGEGGAPNVTFTLDTITPLVGTGSGVLIKDAGDKQGQGFSAAFTIDRGLLQNEVALSFDYATDSAYVDGDVGVYIYDRTNGKIIYPGLVNLPATFGPPMSYRAVFSPAPNSTSYRLIFHIQSTSAAAYRLAVDNIKLGEHNDSTLIYSDSPVGTMLPYGGIDLPAEWYWCIGESKSRVAERRLFNALTKDKGVVSITIASPGVVTLAGHGLITGDNIELTTTGALPTGLAANTNYFVIYNDANSFWLATSLANALAGTKINTSVSQSGSHSLRHTPWGVNGASSFYLPDARESSFYGISQRAAGITAHDLAALGQFKDDQMQGHYKYIRYQTPGFLQDGDIAVTPGAGATAIKTRSPIGGENRLIAESSFSDGVNGTPREGTVTRGKILGVNYIIKYTSSANVKLASEFTEYASNSSADALDNATAFAQGPNGSLLQNFAPAGVNFIYKRIRWARPMQASDLYDFEFLENGVWVSWLGRFGSRQADDVAIPTTYSGITYTAVNEYEMDVRFYAKADPSTAWAALLASYWRMRKISQGNFSEINGPATIDAINREGYIFGKNKLINGNMAIDQRNVGASKTYTAGAGASYGVDRWSVRCTGANVTGQRVAGDRDQYGYKVTGAVGNTLTNFNQFIESANAASLKGKQFTVSAWIKSDAARTVTIRVYRANGVDNFGAITELGSVNVAVTTVLQKFTLTVTGDSSTANGISVDFRTEAGLGAAAWVQYEQIQLEEGPTATNFEQRPYGLELALCQRYFEKSFEVNTAPAQGGVGSLSTNLGKVSVVGKNSYATHIPYKVTKRKKPTLTLYGDNNGYWIADGVFSATNTTLDGENSSESFSILQQITAGFAYVAGHYTADAEF